jgi:ERCC4-type nuclease
MIYIDYRAGSGPLAPLFLRHRSLIPSSIVPAPGLTAADFCFSGNGPRGTCMVGIERKTLTSREQSGRRFSDALTSIRSGRFSGEQLPKLQDHYEFVYVIVEGVINTDPSTGYLRTLRGKEWETVFLGKSPFYASELYGWAYSISLHAGVQVIYSPSAAETVEHVCRLHEYYTKPWDKHHAHLSLHTSPVTATLGKAGTVRRVAAALTGVGWEKSAAVAERFKSVKEMTDADEGDWKKVPGFGKVLSKRVWEELRGEFESGDGFE